ncbi:uncharacterized protein FOMMEDRAFT_170331 [Fomitiporia mediterranea MF3/22]|uniref:uncharacterized protein n=1 Tax=Fomitiporia mediterranea (strain MF3/22) TaxID=694068 RepID=UPI0004409A68|nr:uncharacterized protein FOMMEDRAFT_170331 [Fomitiporia mediterranea MF3/22]EJC99742.1 hypothetical protein FOMMEDRAFT_170331 [Fomitiporia mediterranea MF3/22]
MLGLGKAGIISTIMEALLYGFSVLMFLLTLWILTRNRTRRRMNYGMIVIACSLQVVGTSELIVNIIRVCQGFLNIGPKLPGGPDQYFADITQPTFIFKSAVSTVQTLMLDGVVIYRTYVVWQNYYVLLLPILGWFGLLTASIGTVISLSQSAEHANDIFFARTGHWITAIWATTLATNLSSSSLLAFRIWNVSRKAAQYKSVNRLGPVLRAVVESGAIYSVTITIGLVLFVLGNPGSYILLDMVSPIISIVFNLLIIRVAFASDRSLPVVGSTIHQGTTVELSGGENRSSRLRRLRPSPSNQMKSLTVEITQFFETDVDASSDAAMDHRYNERVDDGEGSIALKHTPSFTA